MDLGLWPAATHSWCPRHHCNRGRRTSICRLGAVLDVPGSRPPNVDSYRGATARRRPHTAIPVSAGPCSRERILSRWRKTRRPSRNRFCARRRARACSSWQERPSVGAVGTPRFEAHRDHGEGLRAPSSRKLPRPPTSSRVPSAAAMQAAACGFVPRHMRAPMQLPRGPRRCRDVVKFPPLSADFIGSSRTPPGVRQVGRRSRGNGINAGGSQGSGDPCSLALPDAGAAASFSCR